MQYHTVHGSWHKHATAHTVSSFVIPFVALTFSLEYLDKMRVFILQAQKGDMNLVGERLTMMH
jgi:hypothetical protein